MGALFILNEQKKYRGSNLGAPCIACLAYTKPLSTMDEFSLGCLGRFDRGTHFFTISFW